MSDFEYPRCMCPTNFFMVGKTVLNGMELLKAFGPPEAISSPNISGVYAFIADNGVAFMVYDDRQTSKYDLSLPTPAKFWDSEWVDVTVGTTNYHGKQEIINFINALNAKFGAFKTPIESSDTYFLGGRL